MKFPHVECTNILAAVSSLELQTCGGNVSLFDTLADGKTSSCFECIDIVATASVDVLLGALSMNILFGVFGSITAAVSMATTSRFFDVAGLLTSMPLLSGLRTGELRWFAVAAAIGDLTAMSTCGSTGAESSDMLLSSDGPNCSQRRNLLW